MLRHAKTLAWLIAAAGCNNGPAAGGPGDETPPPGDAVSSGDPLDAGDPSGGGDASAPAGDRGGDPSRSDADLGGDGALAGDPLDAGDPTPSGDLEPTPLPCTSSCDTWFAVGPSELAAWDTLVTWDSLTLGVSATADASNPRAAIDPLDRPLVMWLDRARDVRLRRWEQPRWVGLGASDTLGGIATGAVYAAFALTSDGRPVVAWAGFLDAGDRALYLQAWDGAAWIELGGSASGPGVSGAGEPMGLPALAVDSLDRPVLAWRDRSLGGEQIFVRRFAGAAWEELDGSGTNGVSWILGDDTPGGPGLAIAAGDRPTVSWIDEHSGTSQLYVTQFDGSGWMRVDGDLDAGVSQSPFGTLVSGSLHADAAGRVIAAWAELNAVPPRLCLRRYEGGGWNEIGGSATGGCVSGPAASPWFFDVGFDAADRPVVAWVDRPSGALFGDQVFVTRWTGSTWERNDRDAAGGLLAPGSQAVLSVSLALGGTDWPLVTWWGGQSAGGGGGFGLLAAPEAYALRYDGSAWQVFGNNPAPGGLGAAAGTLDQATLVFDAWGRPVLAWYDRAGIGAVRMLRWRADAWEELGSPSAGANVPPDGDGPSFALALAPGGAPWVAFADDSTTPRRLQVRRWGDDAWVGVGATDASASYGDATAPALAIRSDRDAVLAWHEEQGGVRQVLARRWNGAAWAEIAGAASGGRVSASIAGADHPFAGVDRWGRVTVAWIDTGTGGRCVFVKQLEGGTWRELAGSASGNGISQPGLDVQHIAGVLAADGDPILTWSTAGETFYSGTVAVRRFDGAGWVSLGEADGTALVTNSQLGQPDVTLGPTGEPVITWADTVAHGSDVFVAAWDGSGWAEIFSGGANASHTEARSWGATVAADGEKVCVAWSEVMPGMGVSMRCAYW